MSHGCGVNNAIKIMGKYLLNGEKELLQELYQYGEVSGKLTKSQILQMWNGVPLENFDDKSLRALFDFLSNKYNLGESKKYFGVETSQFGNVAPIEFDRKQLYLDTIKDESKRIVEASVLNRVGANIESVFLKDVCELTKDELIAGFSNMGYSNRRIARNEISIIKHYIEWCSKKGYFVPAATAIEEVTASNIGIKKALWYTLIPTPERLRSVIGATKDPDGPNADSIIICLYWMGLTFDELYELKMSDVNLIEGTVTNPYYGSIKIPAELLDVFTNYINNDVVYKANLTLVIDKTEYFVRKFIYSGSKPTGERFSKNRINMLVSNFKKQHTEMTGEPIKISSKNLRMSGACWRIYQHEQAGETLSDDLYQFESRISAPIDLEEFKKTYCDYKEIFYGTK